MIKHARPEQLVLLHGLAFLAAEHGRAEVAELLIAHGVELGATDRLGRTPLHVARAAGKSEVAGVLRLHGAKE